MNRMVGMLITLLLVFAGTIGHAMSYYVAVDGADTNPGTLKAPFQTITKAADVMVASDTCYLRAGTYRETLHPANSGREGAPITFSAYQSESVVISGADSISGWTPYQQHILAAPMAWDLGEGRNQVFVNGRMSMQASFPHRTSDLLHPALAQGVKVIKDSDTIECSAFDQPEGYWTGGTFWGSVDPRWAAQTAKITSSSPGKLTVTGKSRLWYPDGNGSGIGVGYLTGVLAAFAAPGEWHIEKNTLYLWPPVGSNQKTFLVEVKHRELTADLRDRSFITLRGLTFFAGGIAITGNNCVIDDCTGQYLEHHLLSMGYRSVAGIQITGSNNQVVNCNLAWCSGSGVSLAGSANCVRNCAIHDVAYNGEYAACIAVRGRQNLIEHNSLYNSGKFLLSPDGAGDTIRYNYLFNCGLLANDMGAMYTFRHDGQGTEIAYNWFRDNLEGSSQGPGVYLDDGCRNYRVHHNVVWDCNEGFRVGCKNHSSDIEFYNNTIWHNRYRATGTHGDAGMTNIKFYNTLTDMPQFVGTDNQGNLCLPAPQFINPAENDFRLKPGSLGTAQGMVIPGVTDGYTGKAPDVGAYDAGCQPWTAGADAAGRVVARLEQVESLNAAGEGRIRVRLQSRCTDVTAGQVGVRLYTARSARILGNPDITYRLQPGEVKNVTLRFQVDVGRTRVELLPDVNVIPENTLAIIRAWEVTRLPALTSLEQVAPALAKQPARVINVNNLPIGTVQIAVAGHELAMQVRVHDRKITRTQGLWDGSCIEVYGLSPDPGHGINQFFLLPATAELPACALCVQQEGKSPDGGSRPAVEIRLLTRPTEEGYTLTALIPLALLGVVPNSDSFLFEISANGMPDPQQPAVHGTAFDTISAFCNKSAYGVVQVRH